MATTQTQRSVPCRSCRSGDHGRLPHTDDLHPELAAAYAETLAAGVDVAALQAELARYRSPRPVHGAP